MTSTRDIIFVERVAEAKSGNEKAIEWLWNYLQPHFKKAVARAIYRQAELRSYRADLMQDCFPILIEMLRRFDPGKGKFHVYLFLNLPHELVKHGRTAYLNRKIDNSGLRIVPITDLALLANDEEARTTLDLYAAFQRGAKENEAAIWRNSGWRDDIEWRLVVREAMTCLTPHQHRCFSLYYLGEGENGGEECEGSYERTAARLGITVKAVDNALMMSRPKIRRWFEARNWVL